MELNVRSERKTRSRRQKENCEEISLDLIKKGNYVRYPGDEINDTVNEDMMKSTRKLRRHTLKEQNVITNSENCDDIELRKTKHSTRKTKKCIEETVTDIPIKAVDIHESEVNQKPKKNKKKKMEIVAKTEENSEELNKDLTKSKKKSKKKKNSKKSTSIIIEDVNVDITKNGMLCITNASNESFHSAVSSPSAEKLSEVIETIPEEVLEVNTTITLLGSNKKRTPRRSKRSSSTTVEDTDNKCEIFIDKLEKENTKQKSNVNVTIGKTLNKSVESVQVCNESEINLNSTYEKPKDSSDLENTDEKLLSSSERKDSNQPLLDVSATKCNLNSTYETISVEPSLNKTKTLDATFDKENVQLNTTFDIDESNSIGTSDTINITFDKTNNSHISINSEDSKLENIFNITPQTIESTTTDEANMENSGKKQELPIVQHKREGTYIKDSPTYAETTHEAETPVESENTNIKLSVYATPNRRKSIQPSSCTPLMKSSAKEKKVLNVTHSIEKSLRKSSIAEPMPRTTKVMFCSPVNNMVCSQIKRKVIKSNLKGSNKSFVFDESLSESKHRVGRKRSYTQNDADDAQNKRLRLANEVQQPVNRTSRGRTFSAAAKLSEPSTSHKKTTTPSKKITRTKLPNFMAVHQKQFEKMESLRECQERKAKRARLLLTPTGNVNLLERISPKENDTDSPKRTSKEPRKPDTPYRPKQLTLASLNPGYTRFGFKMNCSVNPFSVANKSEVTNTKEIKSNSIVARPTILPSRVGATSTRRDIAKQTVMREKSFVEKRDVKRKENRTIIKGVRTNRRFDLQMQMRNIN